MKDPKVGERCVYYDGSLRLVGEVCTVGKLVGFSDGSIVYPAHPKQLRRLIKKPKVERWTIGDISRAAAASEARSHLLISSNSPTVIRFDYLVEELIRIAAARKK